MKQLVDTRKIVEKWRNQEKRLTDAAELLVLALEDNSLIPGVQSEVDQAASQLEQMEFELAFSGKYDDRNAILSIHAGAGGTESQDWADRHRTRSYSGPLTMVAARSPIPTPNRQSTSSLPATPPVSPGKRGLKTYSSPTVTSARKRWQPSPRFSMRPTST